jgi:adenylate cyclase
VTDDDDRQQMIEYLGELGVSPSDVPENLNDAAALASDIVISRDDKFSIRDVASGIDQPVADVADGFRHAGIHVDDFDAVLFNESDIEFAAFLRDAVGPVLTEDEGQEILHVAATALSSIAEASVAGHVQGPERRTSNIVENARLNAFTAELSLELSKYLAITFRHHIRQAAESQRRTQSLVHREVVTATIGFIDLVGFTAISQDLAIPDLVRLVKQFEASAHELAHETRSRIVKLIGDEVMIATEDPADAAAFVAGMIAAQASSVIPRGGLAHGDLVNIHGDYFGPVVNLAARLTDCAVPGEVLVDDAVAAHVNAEPAGRRMLKGFDEPIQVHSLLLEQQ